MAASIARGWLQCLHWLTSASNIRTCCSSRQRRNRSQQERHPTLENISPFPRIAECPYLTAVAPLHFVSGHNYALFLINLCKELPDIVKQEIGLFQSREVSALRHLRPLYYVVCLTNPAKRSDSYLPRKIRVRHGSLQASRRRHFLSGEPVLPIDSHGGAHRTGHPIERNLGQKCVVVHSRKKIAVVVRQQLKFINHPSQPPDR